MPDYIDDELKKLGIGTGGGGTTTGGKVPAAPIPPNPYGFIPVGDGTTAIDPNYKNAGKSTPPGAKTYYDSNTKQWVTPRPATSSELALPRVGAASTPVATANAQQPTGTAAPAATTGTRSLSTPGANPVNFTVPGSYERGPSGYTVGTTQGQPNSGTYRPYEINYTMPGAPTAVDPLRAPQPYGPGSPPPESAKGGWAAPFIANAQGMAQNMVNGQMPPAGYGPIQDAKVYQPPSGAGAPAGGIDLSPMKGTWLSDGSAWFPIKDGRVVSPDVVALIAQKWSDKPQEIPTALAIAARESNGNAKAEGVNGPDTGAPGTHDNGTFQMNDMHLSGTPTSANGGVGTLGHPEYTREAMKDPATNVAAARQLYDNNAGWSAWGGPNPYEPKGYNVGNLLSNTAPPANAIGPVTGTVGQGWENSPAANTGLPRPPGENLPPLPNDNPNNGPKMGPATGGNPAQGMPQPNTIPMAPNGFTWGTPPNWATAALFPNSDQALPERALSPMGLNPATSTSSRALPGTYPASGDPRNLLQAYQGGGLLPEVQHNGGGILGKISDGYRSYQDAVNGGVDAAKNAIGSIPPEAALPFAGPLGIAAGVGKLAYDNAGGIANAYRSYQDTVNGALSGGTANANQPQGLNAVFPNAQAGINNLLKQGQQPRPNLSNGAAGNSGGTNPVNQGAGNNVPGTAVDPLVPPSNTRILMDGPQIAHLGDRSQGYNPVLILQGAGVKSSGDSATDAVMAARILQQQAPASDNAPKLQGQSVFYQGEKSGMPEWMTRSDSGYSFEPGRVNSINSLRSPIGGSDTPLMNPQGIVMRAPTDMTPAGQAQIMMNAGYGPRDVNGNVQSIAPTSNTGAVYQGAWNAGSNPQYGNAANMPSQDALLAIAAAQAEKDRQDALGGADGPVRGFAQGGSVNFNPNAPVNQRDLAIAIANFGKKEAGPAESKFSSIASQQWNPNDDLRMRNFAAGGDVAVDPLKPTPADQGFLTPVANRQATTNAFMPTATPGAPDIMSNDVLKPYQDAQQRFANQQHLRDVTGYQRTRAGLGAAQGIEVTDPSGLPTDPLRAGQFYDPTKWLNNQMGQITGLQTQIAGYGPQGDPGVLEGQRNTLEQQLAPLNQIQSYQQELAALGNQRDSASVLADRTAVEGSIKRIQDDIANAGQTGIPSQFSGLELGPLQAQLAALDNEYTHAQGAANRRVELGNLLGDNTLPVSGRIGDLNAQKAAIETQLANSTKAADARTTLRNLIARQVPKFAGGGSMVTQEPLVGIPARELMSHQTPQFMVGEPQQPGGPPMAEKLNIQPLNRPSMSPRVQRLVPNLADPLRPIGAAA